MSGQIQSLAWGVLFNFFYMTLCAICTNIFRATAPLSTPVAFVFLFLGEASSTIPLIPVAWRNWTVSSPRRFAIYGICGFLLTANFLVWREASTLIPLGPYAAIVCSGILFSPALAAALRRRCVRLVEVAGILAALVGLLLVTHPAFLFEKPVDVPVRAYCFAAFNALVLLICPFFFGATADEHWSNFLVLRLICSFLFAGVCFGVGGGFGALAAAPPMPSIGVGLVGFISTIYRLSQQIGCYELESCDLGLAGLLGNVVTAGVIPTTALLSAVFFGETLSAMEGVGVGVVFSAIVVFAVAKGCSARDENEKKSDEERL